MSFTTGEVSSLLGISERKIRNYARAGFLKPARDSRNGYVFSFQDLVVLRAAEALAQQDVAPRTIVRALRRLRKQLPVGRSLTEVSIAADGARVVVSDGATSWNPLSGQLQIAFNVADLAAQAEPIAKRRTQALLAATDDGRSASEWFEIGVDLEAVTSQQAKHAYVRTLELDPRHADAHVNLGRILHEEGLVTEAATHYLQALRYNAKHAIAAYNLGVAMEDLGRLSEAMKAYQQSASADSNFPDVHYNLAKLHEKIGNRSGAIRHFTKYRRLIADRMPS